MTELRLVGLHEDGEQLILADPDGAEFSVLIDDALRAAVRRDRPRMEHHRAQAISRLSPREIQARIRAGVNISEIAAEAETDLTQITRYEGPVLAERQFIAQRAQAAHVGKGNDSPQLGDLVTDRLAARGLPTSELVWDATRVANDPWTVQVTFTTSQDVETATWSFDQVTNQVQALNDAARGLTETKVADEPIPLQPRLRSLHAQPQEAEAQVTELFDVEQHADLTTPAPSQEDEESATQALLNELQSQRGVRQFTNSDDGVEELEEDEFFDGFGPTSAKFFQPDAAPTPLSPASAPSPSEPPTELKQQISQQETSPMRMLPFGESPADSTPIPAVDPEEVTGAASGKKTPQANSEPAAKVTKTGRRGRSQVPSWDEIVFGTKQDED